MPKNLEMIKTASLASYLHKYFFAQKLRNDKKKLPHLLATFTTTQALPLYTPRSTLGDNDHRFNSKVARQSIYKDNGTHLLPIDVFDGEVVETRWGGGAD